MGHDSIILRGCGEHTAKANILIPTSTVLLTGWPSSTKLLHEQAICLAFKSHPKKLKIGKLRISFSWLKTEMQNLYLTEKILSFFGSSYHKRMD